MSVYLHVTLEIRSKGLPDFLKAMEETAVPFLEKQGWRLAGAFIQSSGRLGTVIDLWELDDYQHYDRALTAFSSDPSFTAFKALVDETVLNETVVFAAKASYMR